MQGTYHDLLTVPPLKYAQPTIVNTGPILEPAQPLAINDTPLPAAAGATTPASKLFLHVDLNNLRVEATQNECFHSHTVDQRLLTGGGHAEDVPTSGCDRRALGWQKSHFQSAPAPTRLSLANPFHPSCPRVQDTHPHDIWVEDNDLMGGSISSPQNIDHRCAKLPPHGSASLILRR